MQWLIHHFVYESIVFTLALYCYLAFTTIMHEHRAHYSPPWADTSIIGIAGSSGSGKTSLAVKIVSSLNLPWVVILSMVTEEPGLDALRL